MLPLKAVPSSSMRYSGGTNRRDRCRRGGRGQVAHQVGQVNLDRGGKRAVDALSELVFAQLPPDIGFLQAADRVLAFGGGDAVLGIRKGFHGEKYTAIAGRRRAFAQALCESALGVLRGKPG
jgi:hypothetical protein